MRFFKNQVNAINYYEGGTQLGQEKMGSMISAALDDAYLLQSARHGSAFVGGDRADRGERVGDPAVGIGGDEASARFDLWVNRLLERLGGGGGEWHFSLFAFL